MTIPNVGVTGIQQVPGIGNTLAQGLGGISQMLQQIEQMRVQKAQQQAAQQYQEGLIANQRAELESKQSSDAAKAQQAQQAAAAWDALLKAPQITGSLNPGEVAALRVMGPEKGAAELQKRFAGQVVGGNDRLVTPGQGGTPTVALGVDQTMTATDNPTAVREFMAIHALDPDTPPSTLSPALRKGLDAYMASARTQASGKNSFNLATDTFASGVGKAAGDRVAASSQVAGDAASDLQTLTELRGLLDQGMITGAGAGALTSFGNALAQLGIGGEGVRDSVARTQAYTALVGQRVGRIIKQFGSGTGLSDADRQYAERIAAGDLSLTPQALRRLLDIADRQNRWVIQQHNQQVEKLPVGPDVKQALRVDLPPSAKPPTKTFPYQGKQLTATLDPQSGRYYVVIKGVVNWVNEP